MSIEHVLLIMCYVMTMTPTTLQATKQLNPKKTKLHLVEDEGV